MNENVLQNALSGLANGGVELLPGNKVPDLEYADDIALLGDNTQAVQNALNCLAIEVSRYESAIPDHVYRCDSQGTISSTEMPEDEARLSDCNATVEPVESTLRAPATLTSTPTSTASSVSMDMEGSMVLSDPEVERYSTLNRHHHRRRTKGDGGTRTMRPNHNVRHSSAHRAPCRVIVRQPVIDLSQMVLVPFDAEAWSGPVLKPRSALTASERAQLVDPYGLTQFDTTGGSDKKCGGTKDLVSRNRRLFSGKPNEKSRNRCDSTPSSCMTEGNLTVHTGSSIHDHSSKVATLHYDSDSGASHQYMDITMKLERYVGLAVLMSSTKRFKARPGYLQAVFGQVESQRTEGIRLVKSGTQRRSTHPDVTETTAGLPSTRGLSTTQPRHSHSGATLVTPAGDQSNKPLDREIGRTGPTSADEKCEMKPAPAEPVSVTSLKTTVGPVQAKLSEYCILNSRPSHMHHVYHLAREAQSQTSPLSQSPVKQTTTNVTSPDPEANRTNPHTRTQTYADLAFTDDPVTTTNRGTRVSSQSVEVQTMLSKSTVNRLYDTDVSSCSTAYESVMEFLTATDDSTSPKLKTSR
ncbi:unnamed protein product [Echinostoma caproni]|uniref:Reverse transcriptase domain-containing protein n=1 Tax=Echinostoma caproni TaxID=27848 RepID=A0A183AFL4_9TREM|nr:unnamed protein product [Echinostoma caproni]